MLSVQRPNEAHVKDNTGEFLSSPTGKHLKVSIEKAIRIKTDDDKKHKSRTYWSLHPDEKKRYRLKVHTVNLQFERFTKGDGNSEFDRNYDESMSHKCVVEAISRLSSMTLVHVYGEKRTSFSFEFETVRKEPHLHLPNNIRYFPDVLCTFNEDNEMYNKWGGKIAIEVTYTHECESYKQEDFMFHNIPVFEIVIESGSARQFPAERPNWPKGKRWGEELVEKHINDLVNWFSQSVIGTLKVDPTSTRVHLIEIQEYENKMDYLKKSNSELQKRIKKVNDDLEHTSGKMQQLKGKHSKLLKEVETSNEDQLILKNENTELCDQFNIEKRQVSALQDGIDKEIKSNKVQTIALNKVIKRKKSIILLGGILTFLFMLVPFFFPEGSAKLLNIWYSSLVNLRNIFV